MDSDVEDQLSRSHTDRIAILFFSRLFNVLIALMFVDNAIIIFAESLPTQIPSLVEALPWLTGTWIILAITLVATSSSYIVVIDPKASMLVSFPVVVTLLLTIFYSPFARIVLGISLSYTGRYLHSGGAPPLPEWPSWIDLGLILGWAVNQLCGGG